MGASVLDGDDYREIVWADVPAPDAERVVEFDDEDRGDER